MGVQSPRTNITTQSIKRLASLALASRHVEIDISNARYVTSFKRTGNGHNAVPNQFFRMRQSFRVVGLGGLKPPTSPLSGVRSNHLSYRPKSRPQWWSLSGSNRRPPACKAGALPAELRPQNGTYPNRALPAWNSECRSLVRTPDRRCCHAQKEVIQPHLPIRLPCYDFTPVIGHTVASALPKVKLPASGATNSHGVTGGVYKARERIHRSILICDY